jgi:hypothetical protein
MCIIIDGEPKDVLAILEEHGEKMWATNPDGAGIMFYNKTEFSAPIATNKIKSLEELKSGVKKLHGRSTPRMAVHLRKASVGGVSEDLTHPFRVGDGWMMHNGTIKDVASTGESDSQTLAKIVSELPKDWYDNDGLVTLLSCVIGESRILMYYNGLTFTFGKWTEHGKCQVSNTKFLEKPIEVASTYGAIQSHYQNRNFYSGYDAECDCEVCGSELKNSYEYRTGLCRTCEAAKDKQDRTCPECGAVSIYVNSCSTCFASIPNKNLIPHRR